MLSKSVIEDVLNAALTQGADFGEIFMEDKYSTSLGMVAGQVETGISGRDYGVGIRVFAGLKAVYAYTNETSRDNCQGGPGSCYGFEQQLLRPVSDLQGEFHQCPSRQHLP